MWSGYDDPKADWLRVLVGALIGGLVVGVVWLGQVVITRDNEPSGSDGAIRQSSGQHGPADSGEPAGDGTTRLERCAEVYTAQDEPLRAADAALGQWEVHIGAMNKLVVGAITLKQARQFWNQTRVRAASGLDDFATADQRFDQRTARCPVPARSAEATTGLESCHQAVAARKQAIRLATVALRTWEEHVHHMNMLRAGDMTPEEATALWLQSWRQGDREARDYRTAEQTAEGLTC